MKAATSGKGRSVRIVDVAEPSPQPPPIQPPPPRPWPYSPDAQTLCAWCNTAVNHYIAIRATGSVPAVGGPSCPLRIPTTPNGIQQATELAETYWPQARSFDVIGGDLEYLQQHEVEGLASGLNRLRDAVLITTFTVTDRPAVTPPAAPPPDTPPAASQP